MKRIEVVNGSEIVFDLQVGEEIINFRVLWELCIELLGDKRNRSDMQAVNAVARTMAHYWTSQYKKRAVWKTEIQTKK